MRTSISVPSSTQISIEPRKEVRFAVVMYGGVSLAIYINGVTQELLRMVRSTAAVGTNGSQPTALSGAQGTSLHNSLNGTERVYRKLSHLLSDEELLIRLRNQAAGVEKEEDDAKAKVLATALAAELEKLAVDTTRSIGTTFIVDILSGTSAGGINAIYLAKALANDQRIERLKQLWISEGDIDLLLNDGASVQGTNLEVQDPPFSLLNSRRMYLKLLRALDDMDQDKAAAVRSPCAKELDLFITATDIEGVPVPLKLADKIVFERRHRNVFHFTYQEAEQVNDFVADSNPFLAFAARCTSSFPFAFEPMRLMDIDEVLETLPNYRDKKEFKSDSQKWTRYFSEMLDPQTGAPNLRFAKRSFGDGGYLDNKPFSYAIDALVKRQSDVPVDRRLIYVEPSPEHPEDIPERDKKPDALENVKKALLDLPTYETIREDLQKVLQRNLLIDRVQSITSGIEKDVNELLPAQLRERLKTFRELDKPAGETPVPEEPMWAQRNLTAMVKEKGRSFLSYRKLRISAVTNEIAQLLARLLNFDADSDQLLAIRCLVRAWRETNYFDDRDPTLNQFLTDFDLAHRIRRLNFIRERIDRLYNYDWTVRQELTQFGSKYSADLEGQIRDLSPEDLRRFRYENADIGWLIGLLSSSRTLSTLEATQRKDLRDCLIFIKSEVNQVYKDVQAAARKLRLRSTQQDETGGYVNPLLKPFEEIGIKAEHLRAILDPENLQAALAGRPLSPNAGTPNEDDCMLVAREFLENNAKDRNLKLRLNTAAEALKDELKKTIEAARGRIGLLLNPKEPVEAKSERGKKYLKRLDQPLSWLTTDLVKAVREYLAYYYYNFEEYDQISFPIFYEADVGEASIVEVIRVSPEDATALIDEREETKNSSDGKGRRKLAGIALHHFGAFLDRTWRQNDIMWGRLDGFERLVTALLPGAQNEALRKVLIEEGHTSILLDELPPESRVQLGGLVSEALVRASAGEPVDMAVAKVTGELISGSPVRTRLEAIIRGSLENQELLDFIKTGYEVNRKLDPKSLLTSISRSTQIIGKVFESIADGNQLDGSSLKWIARLGQLFWGFVEVAVPNSIRNLLWNRWLAVVYTFEVFTIFGGILLTSQGAEQFGWIALGITVVLNVIVLILKDVMRGRRAVFRATALIVCVLILLLATLGVFELLGPFFGIHWGGMYPMTWLKETIKAAIPFRPDMRWFVINLGILSSVTALIVLLNAFFGLVDFSWLVLRLQLLQAWWKQSRIKRDIPWGGFKPIQIIATDLQRRTRVFPGRQDLFLLPFSFSTLPPPSWIRYFEAFFKEQVNALSQQLSASNREIVVVSTAAELPNAFARLRASAKEANERYQADELENARKQYCNQKWIVRMKRSPLAAQPALPANIMAGLEQIRTEAAQKMSRWMNVSARVIGVLTVVLGLVLLFSVVNVVRLKRQHPETYLPGGLNGPGIALQRARTPQEAELAIQTQGLLVGKPTPEAVNEGKRVLTNNISADQFVILYYAITLGALCLWLTIQSSRGHRWFSITAGLSVLIAAVFDRLENSRILDLLNENTISVVAVERVAFASSLKWMFLFLMLGLLGRKLSRMNWSLIKWTGFWLLLCALVGAVGLLGVRIAIEGTLGLMAIGYLLMGIFFLVAPNRLRDF
jgi:patatin-related protein